MTKVSVLIPTYKEPEVLDLCLRSCIEGCSDLSQIEIIVGVDGFYEENKSVLDKWSKYIKLLIMDENVGLNRMTNLLVYNSTSPLFLLVNDDNLFGWEWDKKLLRDYKDNSILTPNQIEPIPSIFPQFVIENLGRDPLTFDLEKYWEYEKTVNKDKLDPSGSTFPIMMAKIDFLRIGGWNESYPGPWVCDLDLFLRARLNGIKTIRTYTTHFYHFVSVGTRSPEKEEKNREIEIACHQTFEYIWGERVRRENDNSIRLSNSNNMVFGDWKYLS